MPSMVGLMTAVRALGWFRRCAIRFYDSVREFRVHDDLAEPQVCRVLPRWLSVNVANTTHL